MLYQAKRWVRPEDLNPHNTLFAGRLLDWVNEQIGIATVVHLKNNKFAARNISNINFLSPARSGEVIEIGVEMINMGKSSITFKAEVFNYSTQKKMLTIDKIIMVCLDDGGNPIPHGLIF
ncbi:acyl-CoA thioesterase [Apibacter raozihei]|uniref:acyl-CoA thioesterase n=1 Tax=Apibacter raozihei TaxID=2500547 RepID=UPI000FE38068|nr:acyl-CoA thioesterase [Apibacter raozihei]